MDFFESSPQSPALPGEGLCGRQKPVIRLRCSCRVLVRQDRWAFFPVASRYLLLQVQGRDLPLFLKRCFWLRAGQILNIMALTPTSTAPGAGYCTNTCCDVARLPLMRLSALNILTHTTATRSNGTTSTSAFRSHRAKWRRIPLPPQKAVSPDSLRRKHHAKHQTRTLRPVCPRRQHPCQRRGGRQLVQHRHRCRLRQRYI